MQQAKTTEYKDALDQIVENTIEFQDDNGNMVILYEDIIRRAYAPADITEKEWKEFVFIVEKQRLDPTLYEVYCAKIQGKMMPIVSYRTYLKRALASKKLVKHPNVKLIKGDEQNKDTWVAVFTTKREGMDDDFVWEVPYTEAGYMLTRDGRKPRGGMWNVQPGFQLKVRAFVQGLRIICADIVGALPHVIEEIQSEDSEDTIRDKPETRSPEIKNLPKNEPDDPETKLEKDEIKTKALNGYPIKINSFDTLEALEAWIKTQKIIERHPYKDDILAMIETRRQALTPKVEEPAINRADKISKIIALTNEKRADVESYINDDMLATDPVIVELLAGNADAVPQFKRDLGAYLASVNDATEYDQQSE
jgi:hypothetical protein